MACITLPTLAVAPAGSLPTKLYALQGLENVTNEPILSKVFKRPSTPPPYAAIHNIAGAAIGITLRPWQEALAAYLKEQI